MAKTCSRLTQSHYVGGGTSTNTASISPAANSVIKITIYAYDTTTMSVSGLGLTYTTKVDGVDAGDNARHWVIYAATGASPGSGSLTLTFQTNAFVDWTVDQISGTINTATPTNNNFATPLTTDATPNATLSAFAGANNGTYAYGFVRDAVTTTAGSGFTLVGSNVGDAMFGFSKFTEYRDSNDTTPDATLNVAAPGVFSAFEILDSAGAAGPVSSPLIVFH